MLDQSTPLIFPALGPLYQTLAPWAEALLRAAVGLALVPHGLRNTFGMFPYRGARAQSDRAGAAARRRRLSAGKILGAGDLGHATRRRPDARARAVHPSGRLSIVVFLLVANFERWRVGKYFWNQLGLEYTLMWTLAALYFLVHGGGPISLDHLLIGRQF